MSSQNSNYFWIVLMTVILFSCLFKEVDGKGETGSGSQSSRSSRESSSTRRSGGLHGRILEGSSNFTSDTWYNAALTDSIYGGRSYILRNPGQTEMPTICTNKYDTDSVGRVYGYFICPKENDSIHDEYCCGPEKREYCCNYEEAREYYGRDSCSDWNAVPFLVAIGCVCGMIIVVCTLFCRSKKTRMRWYFFEREEIPANWSQDRFTAVYKKRKLNDAGGAKRKQKMKTKEVAGVPSPPAALSMTTVAQSAGLPMTTAGLPMTTVAQFPPPAYNLAIARYPATPKSGVPSPPAGLPMTTGVHPAGLPMTTVAQVPPPAYDLAIARYPATPKSDPAR